MGGLGCINHSIPFVVGVLEGNFGVKVCMLVKRESPDPNKQFPDRKPIKIKLLYII